jgi:hypothetical protein
MSAIRAERRRHLRKRPSSSHTIPDASNPELLQKFRRVLQSIGYHTCGIAESMETSLPVPPLLDDESPPTPLNTLLRLFDREKSVTAEAAASSFSPLTVTELVEAGFVRKQGRKVSSTVRIEPYGDLLLVHPWGPESKNSVMSISGSSLELAHFTVRSPFRKTLDLGTGSGLQAILARGTARRYTPSMSILSPSSALNSIVSGMEFVM